MCYQEGKIELDLLPKSNSIVCHFITRLLGFFFFFAGQRPRVQPVIFERDRVTCLGVKYAQRRDDT